MFMVTRLLKDDFECLNSFSNLHVFRPISGNFTYHCGKFPNSFKVKLRLETRVLSIVKKESKKT